MTEESQDNPASAAHLIHRNHRDPEDRPDPGYGPFERCYFCGWSGPSRPASDVISEDYFSDYPLRTVPDSDRVCEACSYCMGTRELKQGHWVASAGRFDRVSTGDLLDRFRAIRAGEYDPPLAVHVSQNPIRSEHAYLWTPVTFGTDPLVVDYDGQTARVEWGEFDRLLAAIEELRWHGFRGDDIKAGEPRVRDLGSVGRDRYLTLDSRIGPHRGTALLEVAWTVSRSRDDQPECPTDESEPTALASNA